MNGSPCSPLEPACRQATSQRPIPRIEDSFDDCSHLFQRFRENLKNLGCAGIVAINISRVVELPENSGKSIALFIRVVGKKLTGRIKGGYRAGNGEFFLLLVPAAGYSEGNFRQDMATIRSELRQYFTFPHLVQKSGLRPSLDPAAELCIQGVFLTDQDGEKADNVLFRALLELFGATSSLCKEKTPDQLAIEQIIGEELLTPVYQPIFSLSKGHIHGYEALSRLTRPGVFTTPDELFTKSAEYGLTSALEILCRKNALTGAKKLKIPGRLFLNVCPALLQTGGHERGFTAALLDDLEIERSRVTFELTERTMINDYELFNRVLSYYREQGYSIAIDDLGAGYAGLKMLAQLEPDYVKLARFLITGIHQSSTRQALVEALVTFCGKIGAKVIAEGIEQQEELDYLIAAGVGFGQGYLLAPPSPFPLAADYRLNGG